MDRLCFALQVVLTAPLRPALDARLDGHLEQTVPYVSLALPAVWLAMRMTPATVRAASTALIS